MSRSKSSKGGAKAGKAGQHRPVPVPAPASHTASPATAMNDESFAHVAPAGHHKKRGKKRGKKAAGSEQNTPVNHPPHPPAHDLAAQMQMQMQTQAHALAHIMPYNTAQPPHPAFPAPYHYPHPYPHHPYPHAWYPNSPPAEWAYGFGLGVYPASGPAPAPFHPHRPSALPKGSQKTSSSGTGAARGSARKERARKKEEERIKVARTHAQKMASKARGKHFQAHIHAGAELQDRTTTAKANATEIHVSSFAPTAAPEIVATVEADSELAPVPAAAPATPASAIEIVDVVETGPSVAPAPKTLVAGENVDMDAPVLAAAASITVAVQPQPKPLPASDVDVDVEIVAEDVGATLPSTVESQLQTASASDGDIEMHAGAVGAAASNTVELPAQAISASAAVGEVGARDVRPTASRTIKPTRKVTVSRTIEPKRKATASRTIEPKRKAKASPTVEHTRQTTEMIMTQLRASVAAVKDQAIASSNIRISRLQLQNDIKNGVIHLMRKVAGVQSRKANAAIDKADCAMRRVEAAERARVSKERDLAALRQLLAEAIEARDSSLALVANVEARGDAIIGELRRQIGVLELTTRLRRTPPPTPPRFVDVQAGFRIQPTEPGLSNASSSTSRAHHTGASGSSGEKNPQTPPASESSSGATLRMTISPRGQSVRLPPSFVGPTAAPSSPTTAAGPTAPTPSSPTTAAAPTAPTPSSPTPAAAPPRLGRPTWATAPAAERGVQTPPQPVPAAPAVPLTPPVDEEIDELASSDDEAARPSLETLLKQEQEDKPRPGRGDFKVDRKHNERIAKASASSRRKKVSSSSRASK